MCPDGQKYGVGDNNDDCVSLACEGGIRHSKCMRFDSWEWSAKRVVCGKVATKEESENAKEYFLPDVVKSGVAAMSGAPGGFCICPNGKKYGIGDNNDDCKSLACEGGVQYSKCNGHADPQWSHKRVVCGNATTKEISEIDAKSRKYFLADKVTQGGAGGFGGFCTSTRR
jgi:hypothetical protein